MLFFLYYEMQITLDVKVMGAVTYCTYREIEKLAFWKREAKEN